MAEAGGRLGAPLELWGHLRPRRCEVADDDEESDEDFEELLAEDMLLEAAGTELAAALPPRRAGEGRRVRAGAGSRPGR